MGLAEKLRGPLGDRRTQIAESLSSELLARGYTFFDKTGIAEGGALESVFLSMEIESR
ncbi:MAG: hypothetical protein UY49_C0024G0005, partial [Microgenomates group bacterium GW2011_GWC1_49_7]